jgi:FAD/FMN-containing dehydrogenase/Fe-S oxidoreductase
MPSMEITKKQEAAALAKPHAPPNKGSGLEVDAEGLAARLRKEISGEVRFDHGSRALYATDGSNYRQIPIGVVIPKTKEDILKTVAACRAFGAPLLSRGGGTSLAGQCCNVAVVMDMSKYYNKILSIDQGARTARIQPGLVLDDLRHAAEKYGLTYGPDPATHTHCTLGGMMGNNSCGVHAQRWGKTVDNTISLEVLTYDGRVLEVGETSPEALEKIIAEGGVRGDLYAKLKSLRDRYADEIRKRYPKIPRRVSGYNLDSLLPEYNFHVAQALIGSESTCVVILEATVRLVENPKWRSLVLLGYPSVYEAGDHVKELIKYDPIGLEGMDQELVVQMQKKHIHSTEGLLPEGRGWLLVEFGGDSKKDTDAMATAMMAEIKAKPKAPSMKLFDDAAEEKEVWLIRESGLGATAFVPGQKDTWEGWEDSAVDPKDVGDYLRDLRQLYKKYKYEGALYGHFGMGCIHTRITSDLITHHGLTQWRAFLEEASDLVLRYNGSFSGEHGDGQSRAELLPKMFGETLIKAFEEFKDLWDPLGKMNPGKVVRPYKILDNLRLGTDYNPGKPETYFNFPADQHNFARAAMRCVGVGKCRRESGGTMCPSYMVTKEEMHSTRGRAHLLFEMLEHQELKDGWKEESVKEALDLCLACKGCKGDCPVNVDMATYKAEFLAHYYKGRLRPRHAYAFGWIPWWSRVAAIAPGLANFLTQTPGLSHLSKWAADMAPERSIPKFAKENFRTWYGRRERPNQRKSPVILWPDTFNNFFLPDTAKAAAEYLEHLGYDVLIPQKLLCCGRPLYDYGFVGMAKKLLEEIVETLRPSIRAGVPIVGLEPSCVAVFRDELKDLLHGDLDAKRLSEQTFVLSEFLVKKAPHAPIPKLQRKAVIQGHCHHKSVIGFKDEEHVLKEIGLDVSIPDSGCCGMAGAFGFEKEHYDVSMLCGERAILPEVRKAEAETLIIADGFSCREQIMQSTKRKPLHLAEVLRMAQLSKGPL